MMAGRVGFEFLLVVPIGKRVQKRGTRTSINRNHNHRGSVGDLNA